MLDLLEDQFDTELPAPAEGWSLDDLLDLAPGEPAGDGSKLAVLRAVSQAESMFYAQRLRLMAAYADERADAVDAEWSADLVAAELNISITRARDELDYARIIVRSLPRTLDAVATGRLDRSRMRQIVDLTLSLNDVQCAELENRIYPDAYGKTPRQLGKLVRKHVIAIDPDAADTQAKEAVKDRRVSVEPDSHGMSWLNAYLRAEDARAVYDRIDAIARAFPADDGRTMNERRADILRDMLLGCGEHSTVRTQVYVTVTAETLLGLDNLPGELRGYGPLTADHIRDIAYDLKARWSGVLVDDDGYPVRMAEKRYRFPTRIAEFIRLRDNTCTFGPCNSPSHKNDADHTIRFPEGDTTEGNAQPPCRRHHRLKHEGRWRIKVDGNTVTWTGPTGHTITHTRQPIAPAKRLRQGPASGEPPDGSQPPDREGHQDPQNQQAQPERQQPQPKGAKPPDDDPPPSDTSRLTTVR